ncbi:hypothetical protein F4677DRAFT_441057 [Hypoxylon crocopeplum]|nr:hypothetical protein F4677DRAFT_441057 [Hypoxylon crocopeplum]
MSIILPPQPRPPPDLAFLEAFWHSRSGLFCNYFPGSRIQYEEQSISVGPGSNVSWPASGALKPGEIPVLVPTVKIHLPMEEPQGRPGFRESMPTASQALQPYLEYYCCEVFSAARKSMQFAAWPNTLMLPVPPPPRRYGDQGKGKGKAKANYAEEDEDAEYNGRSRYAYWSFKRSEDLARFTEDPVAVWREQKEWEVVPWSGDDLWIPGPGRR